MTRIFGGILPYEAEVAEPDGPRIAAWVLADYADRADAIFQKWLAKHDAHVAAQALEAARGPYRCCPHCADDTIHDVEKDGHTVPCQLCQNDIIQQAKAEALREAAQKYQWGGWAERNPAVHADLASRRRQAEHAVAWLRTRADQIEKGDRP